MGKFTLLTNYLPSTLAHTQLCDACDHSIASVFCETEQSVFCSNCDWKNHKLSSSSLHNRRPTEVFTGCPSVSELLSFIRIEDLGDKPPFSSEVKLGCGDGAEDCDGLLDLSNWGSPVISGFDGLILSSDFDHGFKPTDVPPLPKKIMSLRFAVFSVTLTEQVFELVRVVNQLSLNQNRNSSGGQHKEEIFHQQHDLAKSEPNPNFEKANVEAIIGFQSLIPDADNFQPGSVQMSCRNDDPISFPAYKTPLSQSSLKRMAFVHGKRRSFKGFT
ncbi:Zinc finger (C3HC4-type RING finger) family protein isoform 1 [Hibiscus syriacus]|uniref:Zinc finger (C3HC4-type RING finger) family protein isoform 1 n=1 Tax=Hibiscus syriacus TaxID=106335 RepID=A0A6A3C815_HIBSY|nr:Zinc finger (C3HC4-type RING finger) family protein isoform 1 [Hibiscus syriacus]